MQNQRPNSSQPQYRPGQMQDQNRVQGDSHQMHTQPSMIWSYLILFGCTSWVHRKEWQRVKRTLTICCHSLACQTLSFISTVHDLTLPYGLIFQLSHPSRLCPTAGQLFPGAQYNPSLSLLSLQQMQQQFRPQTSQTQGQLPGQLPPRPAAASLLPMSSQWAAGQAQMFQVAQNCCLTAI